MVLAADTDIWAWEAHPEVWVLVAGAAFLAWYAVRVVGPHAVAPGEAVVTRKHGVAYVAAVVVLWFASDWPLHDISEEYLYSAHMLQHLLISLVVPPLLLAATPRWLARLIMHGEGRLGVWTRRMTHPVVAGLVFNLVVALTHLTAVVNLSVENGPFHYLVHLVVFVTALWMWIPVVGPLPEFRLSPQGSIVYLFLMSVLPTVPAGFLTFARGSLYEAYDHQVRLWGIGVTADQQAAGLIMKLVGGIYLWSWIVVRFAQLSRDGRGEDAPLVLTNEPRGDGALTYEQVRAEFDRSQPAPAEHS